MATNSNHGALVLAGQAVARSNGVSFGRKALPAQAYVLDGRSPLDRLLVLLRCEHGMTPASIVALDCDTVLELDLSPRARRYALGAVAGRKGPLVVNSKTGERLLPKALSERISRLQNPVVLATLHPRDATKVLVPGHLRQTYGYEVALRLVKGELSIEDVQPVKSCRVS